MPPGVRCSKSRSEVDAGLVLCPCATRPPLICRATCDSSVAAHGKLSCSIGSLRGRTDLLQRTWQGTRLTRKNAKHKRGRPAAGPRQSSKQPPTAGGPCFSHPSHASEPLTLRQTLIGVDGFPPSRLHLLTCYLLRLSNKTLQGPITRVHPTSSRMLNAHCLQQHM